MLFRLLFAAAVGDCYLNGPSLREEEKLVATALSIIAVLVNEQYAFILAELAWFIVFARAGWEAKPAAAQAGGVQVTTVTTVSEVKKANECPAPLKKAIDESLEIFLKHKEGDVSAEGQPWEVVSDNGEEKVWKAKYPGQSVFRWRAHGTLYGPRSGIVGEMFDYAKRAGPKGWDPNLAKGRIHKEFDNGYKIAIFSTNPVLGGLISPREFIEARVMKDGPNHAFINSGLGIDEKSFGSILGADFPTPDKSCTRAQAFPGCGFYLFPANPSLDPETPQEWRYQFVVCTAIGGWIPAGTINSATSQVMAESLKLQREHMLQKFKA